MTEREKQGVSRRWILKGIGAGLASVPAVGSLACSNDDPEAGESTGDVGTSSGTDDTETNAGADSTGSGDCQAAVGSPVAYRRGRLNAPSSPGLISRLAGCLIRSGNCLRVL